jgi:hypothetical protein
LAIICTDISVSIIAGPITAQLGWKYLFYIALPFIVLQFLLLVLFVPETAYLRAAMYNVDTNSALDLNKLGEIEKRARLHEVAEGGSLESGEGAQAARVPTTASGYRAPPPRKTFVQRMALYTGTYSSDNILKMVISSVVIMTNVGASWTIFISGLLVAWYVAVSFVSAQILFGPPYLFDAAGVGYTSTGPLIGGILGSVFCSFTLDPFLRWCTKRNNGV